MNRLLLASFLTAALAVPALAEEKAGPNDNKPPEGFTALFNGKDLTGWKGHIDMKERATLKGEALESRQAERNKIMEATWTVHDGILVQTPQVVEVKGKQQKRGVNLQTVKDYGDFEFWVDWKIEKAGDSGIYLRGQPQVQIWDSDHLPKGLDADVGTGSGGLWNNPLPKGVDPKSIGKTPLKRADKPVGEWNTFRIIMKGANVTVYLNGELVVDNRPLAAYKAFNDKLPEKGPIELQYHGDKLWFKNIYIKELK
jgi:3-keto-disaccharide hydrolase